MNNPAVGTNGGGGGGQIRLTTISPRPNPDSYASNRYSTKNMNEVSGINATTMANGTSNLSHVI